MSKTFCHCGGEIINNHHCTNGHVMLEHEMTQARHTAMHDDMALIQSLRESARIECLIAMEFGYMARQLGMTLEEAHQKYQHIRG